MWKLLPCSMYDIPVLEGWLAEQARRGRLFTGFWGGYIAQFEKGEPRPETYRLEPGDGSPRPGGERLKLYEAAGWEFCCAEPNHHDLWVFRASRPAPTPIHTDPVTQGIAYERLQKRLRRREIPCILALLAIICLYVWRLCTLSLRGLAESSYDVLNSMYWITYALLVALCIWGDLRALKGLVSSLKAGIPMEHGGVCRSRRRTMIRGTFLALVIFLAGNLALMARGGELVEWPDARTCPEPLPYVTVQTLGADPQNPAANAERRDGDLASAIYTVWDGDIMGIPPVSWKGEVVGTASAKQSRTQAYRLRLAFLAGPLLKEIREENLPPDAEQIEDSPLDECWYGTDETFQYLVLRRGRWVLWTRARVPDDLRDHLNDFAAALERMGD